MAERVLEAHINTLSGQLLRYNDYVALTSVESISDLRSSLATTALGSYIANIRGEITPSSLRHACFERIIEVLNQLLIEASGKLLEWIQLLRHRFMIENVCYVMFNVVVHAGMTTEQLMADCNPVGVFDGLAAVAASANIKEAVSFLMEQTPLHDYFCDIPPQLVHVDSDVTQASVEILRNYALGRWLLKLFKKARAYNRQTGDDMDSIIYFDADRQSLSIAANAVSSVGFEATPVNIQALMPPLGQFYPTQQMDLSANQDPEAIKVIAETQQAFRDCYAAVAANPSLSMEDAFTQYEARQLYPILYSCDSVAPLYAWIRLAEIEARNIGWIAECLLAGQPESAMAALATDQIPMNLSDIYLSVCRDRQIEPKKPIQKVLLGSGALMFKNGSLDKEAGVLDLNEADILAITESVKKGGVRRRLMFKYTPRDALTSNALEALSLIAKSDLLSELSLISCDIDNILLLESLRQPLIDGCFSGLDFSGNPLGPPLVEWLLESLQERSHKYEPLKQLFLRDTDQTPSSIYTLLAGLTEEGHVLLPQSIDIGDHPKAGRDPDEGHLATVGTCSQIEHVLRPLTSFLASGDSSLEEIYLSHMGLGDDGAVALMRAMAEGISRARLKGHRFPIRILDLSKNGITRPGISAIGAFIIAFGESGQTNALKRIVLDGNPIGESVTQLCLALSSCQSQRDLVVSLRRCAICDPGFQVLARLLISQGSGQIGGIMLAGNHFMKLYPHSQYNDALVMIDETGNVHPTRQHSHTHSEATSQTLTQTTVGEQLWLRVLHMVMSGESRFETDMSIQVQQDEDEHIVFMNSNE